MGWGRLLRNQERGRWMKQVPAANGLLVVHGVEVMSVRAKDYVVGAVPAATEVQEQPVIVGRVYSHRAVSVVVGVARQVGVEAYFDRRGIPLAKSAQVRQRQRGRDLIA